MRNVKQITSGMEVKGQGHSKSILTPEKIKTEPIGVIFLCNSRNYRLNLEFKGDSE